MLTGFATGRLFELPDKRRKRILPVTGIAALLVFVVIRLINLYGDQTPWSLQKNFILQSFLLLMFPNIRLLFCLH